MIIRGPRLQAHFTILDNGVIRDARLSFRARGILAYILSQPDGWRCTSDHLADVGTEGREAIRTALRELEAVGYMERRKEQNEAGQWATHVTVYDRPRTDDGFPGAGGPDIGSLGAKEKYQEKDYLAPTTSDAVRTAAPEDSGAEDTNKAARKRKTRPKEERVPAEVLTPLVDALIEVTGQDRACMSDAAWGRARTAGRTIALLGGTPEEVVRRAKAYGRKYSAPLTDTALASRWGEFPAEPVQTTRPVNTAEAVRVARQWFREDLDAADIIGYLRSNNLTHPDEVAAALEAVGLSEVAA